MNESANISTFKTPRELSIPVGWLRMLRWTFFTCQPLKALIQNQKWPSGWGLGREARRQDVNPLSGGPLDMTWFQVGDWTWQHQPHSRSGIIVVPALRLRNVKDSKPSWPLNASMPCTCIPAAQIFKSRPFIRTDISKARQEQDSLCLLVNHLQ